MCLVFKSFLGSGKSSKVDRGHLSGEASEAKNWMLGVLGKRSKVRWGYACLSGEWRGRGVRGRLCVSWVWSHSICDASLGKVECGQAQRCGGRFLG